MNQQFDIDQIRSLVHSAICRSAGRKYATPGLRVHAFMEIFENKLKIEIENRKKLEIVRPYLDTMEK